MRSFVNIISGLFILCVITLSFACTPGSCFEETNAFLKASFYLDSTGKPLAPDSLTLYGIGKDTTRYSKARGVKTALIPLDASARKCTFVIKINGVNDTISFVYSSYVHLISKECGYTYYHGLDSVFSTRHIIDTVQTKLRTITTLDAPNIFIYY